MIQKISLSVFLIIFPVTVYLLYRRVSLLPEPEKNDRVGIKVKIRRFLSKFSFKKRFSWNSFLQKILSKIRVVVIKVESMIGNQLQSLRRNSKKE